MNFPETEYDVLVVGAGPAGCRAAQVAAAQGGRVLLIDSKRRIGEHPHCGEFVSARLFADQNLSKVSIIQSVNSMETRIVDSQAPREGFKTESGELSGKSPIVPLADEQQDLDQSRVTNSPGYVVDRARFDRELAREAAACGATVMCGCRFVGFENDSCVVKLDSQEAVVQAKCVVAADGALSSVAAAQGLPHPEVLKGAQVEAPLERPLDRTFVFLRKSFVGGYGWLFPKGKVANVGVGVVHGQGLSVKAVLEDFLELLLDQKMVRPGRLAVSGGLIPVSGIREPLIHKKIIFTGDAAGLTHPITGAGIPQAVISGELAGEAAASFVKAGSRQHLVNYENEIRARYAGVLGHALSKRTLMMRDWNTENFQSVSHSAWIAFDGYKRRVRGL